MMLARSIRIAALTLLVACDRDGSTTVSPSSIAGTYTLRTVNGAPVPTSGLGAVLSGAIILGSDGSATRRIRYQLSGVATDREMVAGGTFSARADAVDLRLVEDPGHPERITAIRARRGGDELTISWANPADFPPTVETYRRER